MTDNLGKMCRPYVSIKIKKFLKDKNAISHFPAEGEGTLSGVIIETNIDTGLARNVTRLIDGGSLTK